jgi:D-xylose 1-dehydrogenase (NADP+, D-xylono-1,5-lactone-forming)
MKFRPIQMGILGAGSFIQRRILPILNEIEEINVVALQKRNLNDAQELAYKYRIPYATSSREELLKRPDVEVVLVATQNHMHEADAIACAAFEKPTLCEKPLATTSTAIIKMLEAFQKKSIPLFVGQALRFKYCARKAQELLQSGRLGRLLSIRAHFSIPLPEENWRHLQVNCGGVLLDIGVHLIDLIRFISDDEIKSVFATANPDYKMNGHRAVQTVSAFCRLAQGAIATFECSFVQPLSSGFEIIGTKARLISTDSLRQTSDSLESLCLIENDIRCYFPIRAENIYVEELKHFAYCIRNKVPTIITAEEGLKNQKVIESIYNSINERYEVQVG